MIGIEAASRIEGGNLDFLDHPRIGNDVKADLMVGLTSPSAPEARRREIGWGYAQGAPSVFRCAAARARWRAPGSGAGSS